MVVAANPGSTVSVAPELDLVKAALLYGDKVAIISPVTTMFLRVEGLERFSPLQQLELLRRVAPILLPAADLPAFQEGIEGVDDFLRRSARSGSLGDRLLRAGVLQKFAPAQQVLSDAVQEIGNDAGIDQLTRARARGLVQIENADPGDAMDLLVSCILSAKLAQTGQHNDDSHTDRIVETFVEKLSRHLFSGREYLIFDEPIARLTEAAIREGLFTPAKGAAGRCAQAMTASGLMGRLPTFPATTVDEVIDIRTELAPALTQFRSAMVTIAKTFSSAAWESDFEDEVHDAWVETVLPAVERIETSVRDNHSLLSLATGITGAATRRTPDWPSSPQVFLAMLGRRTSLEVHLREPVHCSKPFGIASRPQQISGCNPSIFSTPWTKLSTSPVHRRPTPHRSVLSAEACRIHSVEP